MRAPVLAALAIALAVPASAHERPGQRLTHEPAIYWNGGPTAKRAGDGRIRLVYHGHRVAAVLGVNQFDMYQREYKRCLAQLAMIGPIGHHQIARARHHAFHEVVRAYPAIRVNAIDLEPLRGGRLATDLWY
ncbi:hypothetical protein [uncultured Jannaschia sp.]|uniref:hypothetical protein n=1 Tax=uncultured Jannaschia sp. TaxID=293347 RepID=UPI00262D9579|nr:hypothetical protein [uncultured Jannaschia sp.]